MYCVGEMRVVESELPVRFIVFFLSHNQSIKISLNHNVFAYIFFQGLDLRSQKLNFMIKDWVSLKEYLV